MTTNHALLFAIFALAAPAAIHAQTTSTRPPIKSVAVGHADPGTIKVDGHLDEPIWTQVRPATGFIDQEPVEGASADDSTEVRFVIEGNSLMIGARMYSSNPSRINPVVGRRDDDLPTEYLLVSLDTRRDRLTAYTFIATPGGTRADLFHPADNFFPADPSWDPVWKLRTSIDSLGWTAEFQIPLTQLRYDEDGDGWWGLNLSRSVPQTNELSYWMLVGRNEVGWSSRMGHLVGLDSLRAPSRLEVVPYVATEGTFSGVTDPADPFSKGFDGTVRAGADLKLGLGSSLTLDATINPDFGQVEADPAVVNLTAFETFFDERRPFFVEGNNLFGGRNTFYSRRIGASPPGSADTPFAQSIPNTTILGAAKVTGRLPTGLSIGALSALTSRETVRTYDPATGYGHELVAPLTGYGVFTAQQELGHNRSTVKASVTAVQRDLPTGSPLSTLLARDAYTALLDGRWRWAGGKYDMSAYVVGSYLEGEPEAILREQLSSRRYFQRPDARNVRVDSGRTTFSGFAAGINHSKMAGNWLWDVDYNYFSPEVELNDLGYQNRADFHNVTGDIRHRDTTPGVFHSWSAGIMGEGDWNSAGLPIYQSMGAMADFTLRNFWSLNMSLSFKPSVEDVSKTRGGPEMRTARNWELVLGGQTKSKEKVGANASVDASGDQLGGWDTRVEFGFHFQSGSRWQFSIEPSLERLLNLRQYVATRDGGTQATYGGRYIFGSIARSELAARLRASVAIRPGLTLQGYFEPFASSGEYHDFGELESAGGLELREYGKDGTAITRSDGRFRVVDGADTLRFSDPSFNIRSFRSNLVLRWEWRPGSTAYLVWQQNRFESRDRVRMAGPGGLLQAFGAPGTNTLALKVSYWLSH